MSSISLYKQGTQVTRGIPQIISNINACEIVADAIRSTLGPRGMDKLIVNSEGKCTITNDGATILKMMDVTHPAARIMVQVAKSQDKEVGDGTTSVILITTEILKGAKEFIQDGGSVRCAINAIRTGLDVALDYLDRMHKVRKLWRDKYQLERDVLEKCAATALSSKVVHQDSEHFSKIAVDAVLSLDELLLSEKMIGVIKVQGGALQDSVLIPGVAFKKSSWCIGSNMQPKEFNNPKIALLNIKLDFSEGEGRSEVRMDSVDEFQNVIDAEWNLLTEKLDLIHNLNVNVVLSTLPIGDVATQYFADRGIYSVGELSHMDMKRANSACGGTVMTSINDLSKYTLGTCEYFEEKEIAGERIDVFTGCSNAKTCTIILRGGTEQLLDEAERALHDSIMVVRRMKKNNNIVAGGGAIEMEISRKLREYSLTVSSKQQNMIALMAKALEIIPKQLCINAGLDATEIMNQLRRAHVMGYHCHGVDVAKGSIANNYKNCVWEPTVVKRNALIAAREAVTLILSVDLVIKNVASKPSTSNEVMKPPSGRGLGRPL